LDIPVFHDDQHGTAIVVLAALRNALKLVKKDISKVKIIMSGAGAAGTAIARLLVLSGATNIIAFDIDGVISKDSPSEDSMRDWFIENSNKENFKGDIHQAMNGADIFIGVSAPKVLNEADVKSMAAGSIVFALANPDPEIDPLVNMQQLLQLGEAIIQIRLITCWHFLASSVDYSMHRRIRSQINYLLPPQKPLPIV